jgi:hypothetical protein
MADAYGDGWNGNVLIIGYQSNHHRKHQP